MAGAAQRTPLYLRARLRASRSPNRRALSAPAIAIWCVANNAAQILTTVTADVEIDQLGTYHSGHCYAKAGDPVFITAPLGEVTQRLCRCCGLSLVRRDPCLAILAQLISYERITTAPITTTDPAQLTELIHQCLLITERVADMVSRYPPLHHLAPSLSESAFTHCAALLARLRTPAVSPQINAPRTHLLATTRLLSTTDIFRTAFLTYSASLDTAGAWKNRPQVIAIPLDTAARLNCQAAAQPRDQRPYYELRSLMPDDDPTQLAELLSAIWEPDTMTLDDALAAARPCLVAQPNVTAFSLPI